MSAIGKSLRFFAYPIVKPIESARQSIDDLKLQLAEGKVARQAVREELAARAIEASAAGVTSFSAEDLASPAKIKDPWRRFEAYALLNEQDESSLLERHLFLRVRRRTALVAAVIVIAFTLLSLFRAPVWASTLLMLPLFLGMVYALSRVFKYALMEWQVEARALHPWKAFMSQPDFFRRLVS